MARAHIVDRQATREEVASHRDAIRLLADDLGLVGLRLRGDGTIVVHSDEPGYRAVIHLSAAASERVGCHVQVITDDVPGAANAPEL